MSISYDDNNYTTGTELQAIALKATVHKPINICNINIPPHDPISDTKINKLIEQMPKTHLLLGDLNSHSTVWGSENQEKSRGLKKVVNTNNLCILNKSNTYLNPFTGSYSAIFLSVCAPIIYRDYGWKVHNDLCSCNYFPIIPESLQPLHEDRLPHRKINKENWQVFEIMCK